MVLTPNGRRQTIKVSPNTPLLQVLEDVCKKHGFNAEDHGLKFQRTVLDLSLQWRFANLPNNAKLEVVQSTRKQAASDSQVRIALQMEDGSRLQDSFSCGLSLWELVTHFPQISASELSEAGTTPVCVYMRDEVCGEDALKKATLKSLGLTGGSAIVRFLLKKDKAPGEEDGMEVTQTAHVPRPSPVAKETLPDPPPPSQPVPAPPHPQTSEEAVPPKSQSPACPMETLPDSTNEVDHEPQETVGGGMTEDDGQEAGPSGLCASSSSPPAPAAPFIPFSGGGQRLGGPGAGTAARTLSSSASSSSLSAVVESPKAKKAKPSFGAGNKQTGSANKPDEDMDPGERLFEPVEREPLVYHLESAAHCSANHTDLPDEFFEVTVDDVRKRFAQLKSERKQLEEAPLMTRTLREAQIKEKMDRYPKVVLRVQFPDRHVLQGFFRPLETVNAVRHFVRSHLEDPQLQFYLFVTPPKTILDDPSVTLFQADLFPGALVYFGSDVKSDFYLKRELLGSSVSALQANESIASCMLPSPRPSSSCAAPVEPLLRPEPAPAPGIPRQDERDPSAHTQAAKSNRAEPGKVPKWLKLPGKK